MISVYQPSGQSGDRFTFNKIKQFSEDEDENVKESESDEVPESK